VDARYASQSRGAPTFLNLGRPYPDPTRFTVVIWGRNLKNFPPQPVAYYLGKVICVTGVVAEYQGGVEIEATNSKQIQER
jgi:hypothetical protein